MEAIRSSETSVNTTYTRCHIPENCFLHSHLRENLKSYYFIAFITGWPYNLISSVKLKAVKIIVETTEQKGATSPVVAQ
jgi:hypothetical protein